MTASTLVGAQSDPLPFRVGESGVSVTFGESGLLVPDTVATTEGISPVMREVWIAEFVHDRSPPFDVRVGRVGALIQQLDLSRWRISLPRGTEGRDVNLAWQSTMPRPVLVSLLPATQEDMGVPVTALDVYQAEYGHAFKARLPAVRDLHSCRRALFRLDLASIFNSLLEDDALLREACKELGLDVAWYAFKLQDLEDLKLDLNTRTIERAVRALRPEGKLTEITATATRAARGVLRIIQALFQQEVGGDVEDPGTWRAAWPVCLRFANGDYRRPDASVNGRSGYFNLEPNGFAFFHFAEFAAVESMLCEEKWRYFWREFERTFVAGMEVFMDVYHRPGAPHVECTYTASLEAAGGSRVTSWPWRHATRG